MSTPTDVKCPVCGAEQGERCNTKAVSIANRLEDRGGRSHPERFRAAEAAQQEEVYKLKRRPEREHEFNPRSYDYGPYEINREKRTWSERNGPVVGGGAPMYWWAIDRNGERVASTYGFDTLREARAWCDEQRESA